MRSGSSGSQVQFLHQLCCHATSLLRTDYVRTLDNLHFIRPRKKKNVLLANFYLYVHLYSTDNQLLPCTPRRISIYSEKGAAGYPCATIPAERPPTRSFQREYRTPSTGKHLGHIYTLKYMIYSKFEFNWVPYVLIAKSDNLTLTLSGKLS